MTWFIGQSLVFILLAFLLGIIVGRLTVRRARKPEAVSTTVSTAPQKKLESTETVTVSEVPETVPEANRDNPEKASKPKPRPRKSAAPATEQPMEIQNDELERIEGIGPKMADALRAAGIRTFAQLAEAGDDTKRRAIRAAGMTFAPSIVTWSRQARLLADGEEAAFAELTARLIAGRDTEAAQDAIARDVIAKNAEAAR
ncbi:DUF4332 domain-containing protein [Actinoplanes sp. L3-i22]|uniref:DUF4332 domain-containing protein n=1 Tax=Actinoplanes sp. L3-i22 TaxID=2836373 RepID=UPI001C76B8D0|nr:DUF4332 domain-containing protein [Actinoplanes sp. L3-i22]BCY07193.1 hypothetical protein L3i22_022810 [Actinoplanes sp. L3-i22]